MAYRELERNKIAWQDIIDHKLIEWELHPEVFEDDDLVAISRQIISDACEFYALQANINTPAPLIVAPNGDGGIVFEWKAGSDFRTIEFLADGTKEKRGKVISLTNPCRNPIIVNNVVRTAYWR